MKYLVVVLFSLTTLGCLKTRSEVKDTETRQAVQQQVVTLQKNTADSSNRFSELEEQVRALNGRTEVVENRLAMKGKVAPLVIGAVVLIPVWFALVSLREIGPLYVFFSMGVIWLADTAAYFAGRAFGRHKLAPTISPGKTWEGVAAAMLIAILYAVILVTLSKHYGAISGGRIGLVALGFVLLTALSVLGDLFESWLKRRSGKKDSGNLFPGHGGILDRIDSITSTMPLAALVLSCCRAPLGL